jgi:hypothetical protein
MAICSPFAPHVHKRVQAEEDPSNGSLEAWQSHKRPTLLPEVEASHLLSVALGELRRQSDTG